MCLWCISNINFCNLQFWLNFICNARKGFWFVLYLAAGGIYIYIYIYIYIDYSHYVCMYMHTYIHRYIYTIILICVYVCKYIYIILMMFVYVCKYICVYIYIYIYIYTYYSHYICVSVCAYIYIYIYVYMNLSNSSFICQHLKIHVPLLPIHKNSYWKYPPYITLRKNKQNSKFLKIYI